MKFYTILLAIIFSYYSCSSTKETIVNSLTGEKAVGYDKDCLYRIGKTPKNEIPQEVIDSYKRDSLYLVFNYASFGQESDRLLSAWAGGKFVTSKGIKPGDKVEQALNIYGKPKATRLEYWKDEQHRIKWEFHGLFYQNLALITDSTFTTILGISVGNQFETDKKYIKENRFSDRRPLKSW
ncbi:MAG: hypothetical protein ACKVUS_12650 [Saprospiraceae bacterium]